MTHETLVKLAKTSVLRKLYQKAEPMVKETIRGSIISPNNLPMEQYGVPVRKAGTIAQKIKAAAFNTGIAAHNVTNSVNHMRTSLVGKVGIDPVSVGMGLLGG